MAAERKKLDPFNVLGTLRDDALVAINGQWDKSDHGFEAQIGMIEQCFVDNNPPVPDPRRLSAGRTQASMTGRFAGARISAMTRGIVGTLTR